MMTAKSGRSSVGSINLNKSGGGINNDDGRDATITVTLFDDTDPKSLNGDGNRSGSRAGSRSSRFSREVSDIRAARWSSYKGSVEGRSDVRSKDQR